MTFTPYMSFAGQCADAFAFYGEVFGGTVAMHRFSEIPPGDGMPTLPQDQQNWVMHAQLTAPDGTFLMGADMPPQFGERDADGNPQPEARADSVAVWRDGPDAAKALFDKLAAGGKVTMPFGATFFSAGFGMCRDRFGTAWMVSSEDPATPPPN
ncbi:VOC family protein [Paracoccus pacificus]|uniref:VOC family protein n=1 Tax=Paracoccus pacificus TaxID=1463598 RepID=A0ABW4RAQ0_9RHOB